MADVLRFDIAKDPKGNPITYGRVGDTDGLTRSVKVFEDGKPLDLTGYVITFEGNTSKYKTKVFDTGGVKLVDATKGEFTYTFPNMAFAVEGQYERAYFSFAKSDTRKTTGDFEIIVFGNSDIDADEAETIITEYNRLVAELHALQEQAIDDMNQNFAEVESEMEVLAQKISDTQAEIDRALAEFEAGDFYTKAETTNVINQLDWQKYPLTQSDGTAKYFPSITPVPNSLADITETGTWYLTANQFNSLIEETTVPTDLRGGGWLIVLPFTGSADSKTVYQMWLANTSSEGKNRRPIIRYWAESKGAPSDWVELASTKALNTHISNNSNPHGVTKEQIGLGNVPNYSVASTEEAEAGIADDKLITPSTMNYFYLAKTQKRRQRWDEGLNWIAHRGNNTTYPENSIPAFLTARRHWGIETDIQVTSDGQWVVMHDATVDRTTNGTGAVASMTLAQFRALRFDTGTNLSYLTDAEKTPPTFEEYLLICKQTNKVPVVEIKSYAYTETHYDLLKETLNRFGYDETNCVIISFDFTVLVKIRILYPNMELHYLVDSITTSNINQAISLGIPAAISSNYNQTSVNDANIKLIHAAGLKVAVWTVPEPSFDAMIKLGVDYITTNSQSGNLRFSKLSLANGFTANASSWNMDTNYVEELGGNNVRLEINLSSGDNTQSTTIADLPSWAIPMYIQYANATIRTSGGISVVSMDVNGRRKTDKPGTITVGIGWSSRTTWVAGSTTYKLD
ncbi:glycerophosphodiester phosphodiesterase family protein [Enterococcus asini]|uniref:glycerophosphodiester phosphodiesterase family protein n=1 Tax=Enterococcus asini TaxID=57732 RepID=UPI00288DCDF3|nr:glycerophosphodiester phosphodiesterase family protein [Enterococcus asini]MDT2743937.1 glycerophosphodiester phosphodiesterase family protein [Enterococcus asini]